MESSPCIESISIFPKILAEGCPVHFHFSLQAYRLCQGPQPIYISTRVGTVP